MTTRQTELPIRVSLGATVGRLVRLVLSESLVLAAVDVGILNLTKYQPPQPDGLERNNPVRISNQLPSPV